MASRVLCLLKFMAFYNQSPPLEWWLSLQTFEWVEYGKDGGLLLSRLGYKDGGLCLASTLLLFLALASSDEASCHVGSCPVKSLKQQGYAYGEALVGPVLWLWTFWTIVWSRALGYVVIYKGLAFNFFTAKSLKFRLHSILAFDFSLQFLQFLIVVSGDIIPRQGEMSNQVLVRACPTLWDPMDCSPPGSPIHAISQARILEWVAMPSSRGSFPLKDQTCVSCIAGVLYCWGTREALSKYPLDLNQRLRASVEAYRQKPEGKLSQGHWRLYSKGQFQHFVGSISQVFLLYRL